MSAGAFLEWADSQDSGRYELIRGEIVAMAPERVEHAHVKFKWPKLWSRRSPRLTGLAALSLTVLA